MSGPVARRGGQAADEVLEELWTLAEAGREVDAAVLAREIHAGADPAWAGIVSELERQGLVVRAAGGALRLSAAGEERARTLVRRHRLAELLLTEVLDLDLEAAEGVACGMEHALSPRAEAAVCALLGHPEACPHGRPIPPGRCCREGRGVAPLLERLADLAPGARGRVALVAAEDAGLEGQLADLGVTPGAAVELVQRDPAPVVRVGHTRLALDDGIARRIWVRPEPTGVGQSAG